MALSRICILKQTMNPPDTKSVEKRRFWERILAGSAFILILTLGVLQGWFFKPTPDPPLLRQHPAGCFHQSERSASFTAGLSGPAQFRKAHFRTEKKYSRLKAQNQAGSLLSGPDTHPRSPSFLVCQPLYLLEPRPLVQHQGRKSLENAVLLAKEYIETRKNKPGFRMPRFVAGSRADYDAGKGYGKFRSGHRLPFRLQNRCRICFHPFRRPEVELQAKCLSANRYFLSRTQFPERERHGVQNHRFSKGGTQKAIAARIPLEPLTGDGSVLIALRFLAGTSLPRNWDRLQRGMKIIFS